MWKPQSITNTVATIENISIELIPLVTNKLK